MVGFLVIVDRKLGKMELNWCVVVELGMGIMIIFILFECCVFLVEFEDFFCDVLVFYFCFRFVILCEESEFFFCVVVEVFVCVCEVD